MSKKLTRAIKSDLKAIKDYPFTAAEIQEMQDIQEKEYWQRGPLKDAFCDKHNRLVSEVNEWFKKNKMPPLSLRAGNFAKKAAKKSKFTKKEVNEARIAAELSGSMRAPKEQVTAPIGEIRVTFKQMRVEGNVIIFEV